MTDEQRIRELLEHILESNCAPEEACAACPELLPKILQQLERVRRIEHQIDVLFPSSHPATVKDDRGAYLATAKLPHIEGYDVEGILGRGGMGVVYTARHLKLNRMVALKMLLAGPYASPLEVARFVRESQAVAELRHPHIVQVYDVGDLDGRPFFTMEFVDGGSLADELAGAPQPALHAAEMTVLLARAVQAAHAKGIIHRDLKPANILLASDGTPKIADFGLARHVDGDPELTISGARVGTPSYMAPEQALGSRGAIGPLVDIYALGAVLYEMLTGRPPFRADTSIETERQVINMEAAPPSRLNAIVPRDLETICLKCLHKDPSRRYARAAELADDVQRFLDGRPVLARPVSALERIWRWGKRNQGVAVALSSVALLLALIVVGSLWAAAHFRKLEGEHRLMAQEKGELADQKGRLVVEKEHERSKAVLAEQRETGLRRQSEAQGKELRRNLYLTEMNLGGQATSVPSGLGRVGELLARWEDETPDLRNWEWYYLNGLCNRSLSTRIGHVQAVHSVAWSPNGARLASAGADRTICIWDAGDERPPLRLIGHGREVFGVAWSPDGLRLASASWDRTVRVWNTTNGAEILKFEGHTAEVFCIAWSRDGSTIASGGNDLAIQIWNAADGASRSVLGGHEHAVTSLEWSPDNRQLASSARDATVRVWDVVAGKSAHTLIGHDNWVNHVAWSPDGSRLASASNDQSLRIWDPKEGTELLKLHGHTQGVSSVTWSPDGTRVASSSDDQTVKIWSSTDGAETLSLRGHTAPLTTVAWNPQGDQIASAGYDRAVKIWDSSTRPEIPTLTGNDRPVESLTWCPRDSALCASSDDCGFIRVWDMARQTKCWTWRADEQAVDSLSWHPAGTFLASASRNGLIRVWKVGSKKRPVILDAHVGTACSVAWSPDGRRIASGGVDKAIRIWDATSKKCLHTIKNHQHTVYTVAWSPDGRRLASASGDRTVKLWDVVTGEEVLCLGGHPSEVITVAWSPDGKTIASAGYDQTIQLWETATGQRTVALRGHTTHIAQVIWSPDGTRLASAGRDGSVKIWDTETGKEALTFANHESQVNAVAWSLDGMILASAGEDHRIRIHDATTGYLAARAPQGLPIIEDHLASNSSRSEDLRIRAETYARQHEWEQAAVDMRQYLLLKADPTWFMLDGIVAGPYPEELNVRCPPEDVNLFGAKMQIAEGVNSTPRVNWKSVPHSAQGIVDFGLLLEHGEHISAYALFPVYSSGERQIAILLGSDDQAVVWLNGERLFESLRARQAIPDEDAISATLKSGWNALLVRVANEASEHVLYLRLSDSAKDLKRLRDRIK